MCKSLDECVYDTVLLILSPWRRAGCASDWFLLLRPNGFQTVETLRWKNRQIVQRRNPHGRTQTFHVDNLYWIQPFAIKQWPKTSLPQDPVGSAESCFFHPLLISQKQEGVDANVRHSQILYWWPGVEWTPSAPSLKDLHLTVSMQSGSTLEPFNTPRGRSCSTQVRPPSACLPGLHAGIFRCGRGWQAGRVRAAPGRNPRAPRHQNTPARRCWRTRSGRWPLQGRMDKVK